MFKKGFTLAEVLITLAIIGIVAAIALPNLIMNNGYKTVGVKLAKFMSTTESAARAYVTSNDVFSSTIDEKDKTKASGNVAVMDFINDAYLIKDLTNTTKKDESLMKAVLGSNATATDNPTFYTVPETAALPESPLAYGTKVLVANLKDNTSFSASLCVSNAACNYKEVTRGGRKTGEPVFILSFDPEVTGLPKKVHHNYNFVVTELGFVFPAADESCLWEIYNNKFVTNSNTFSESGACYGSNRTTEETKE